MRKRGNLGRTWSCSRVGINHNVHLSLHGAEGRCSILSPDGRHFFCLEKSLNVNNIHSSHRMSRQSIWHIQHHGKIKFLVHYEKIMVSRGGSERCRLVARDTNPTRMCPASVNKETVPIPLKDRVFRSHGIALSCSNTG